MNDAPNSPGVPGFHGRDEELAELYDLFEDSKRSRAPNFAVVVGDSGLGKSRLVQAVHVELGRIAVRIGQPNHRPVVLDGHDCLRCPKKYAPASSVAPVALGIP